MNHAQGIEQISPGQRGMHTVLVDGRYLKLYWPSDDDEDDEEEVAEDQMEGVILNNNYV